MRPAFLFIVLLCLQLSVLAQGYDRFPIKVRKESLYYRCYNLMFDNFVGTGYDPRNNFFIVKSHRNVHLIRSLTDFDIRVFRKGNSNLSFDLTYLRFVRLKESELFLSAGYKRILYNHQTITEQIYMGPTLYQAGFFVTVAHAVQQQQFDERNIASNGVMLKVYKEYIDRLVVIASTTFWFDEMQYSVRIREYFSSGTWAVGFGWDKVNDWQGLDVELLVSIQ